MISTTLLLLCAAQAAPNTPCADVLLPRPQQVEILPGECPLERVRQDWHLSGKGEDARKRLRKHIEDTFERAGLGAKPALFDTDAGLYHLGTSPDAASLAGLPEEHREEGYILDVSETGVTIEAATERGLFYGLMTLEQLLNAAAARNKESLPCLRIIDWPALKMRGPHEDYGRDQLPTVEDHKRSIRTAARFKANTYYWFIEPDHFVYAFDPEISTEYDRFTFDEIRELVAYARGYYIEVIPVIELLGHMEMTLRHDRYKHLSETGDGGGTLCPTSDEAFTLVRSMIDEIAPAFGARYFHCGLDESVIVGDGQSAKAVKEKGIEAVYADYYTNVNDAVKAHGQTMIMYADIVLNHPGVLDLLPKDIVMMFWDYSPRERYEGLDRLKECGYPVLALSGMWDWNNLYPIYPPGFVNMETLAAQAAEVGAMGHCVSSWGDGFRGAAGINLSELNAYGFAYCDAVSWRPQPIAIEEFSRAFALDFFGTAAPELAEALTRLARCQGNDLSRSRQARVLFHSDPKEAVIAADGADDDTMAFWRSLKQETETSHALLEKVTAPDNSDYLKSIDLAARMLLCSADMALAYHDIAQAMAGEQSDKGRFSKEIRALETRHRALWEEYQQVWLATNRPLNLNHIGPVWTGVSGGLGQLAHEMENGTFPPRYEKGLRASFDFDGQGAEALTERTGTGMMLTTAKGEPLIVEGGPNGTGNCLRLPHGAHLEATDDARVLDFGVAPFLVEAWVRHEGQQEQQYGASIFSYGLGGGFRLGLNHKGELLLTLYGVGEVAGTRTIVPADGEWHHVAANFSACHRVDMYLDGHLTDTLDLKGHPSSPATPLIRVGNEIGLVTPFEGGIDRIRVSAGIFAAEELDAAP